MLYREDSVARAAQYRLGFFHGMWNSQNLVTGGGIIAQDASYGLQQRGRAGRF